MKGNALSCAMQYLSRREHSTYELVTKLEKKGYSTDDIHAALANCQRLGLQSDVRFCENLSRTRIRQGYGPIRIRQELLEKRVASELIEAILIKEEENWLGYAREVRKKKYPEHQELTFEMMQKEKKFLYYRGFSTEIIAEIFSE